jgi:hypothetical protein
VDDLCTFAELAGGQRVYEGGLAGLTSDEWLSRWLMVSSEPRALYFARGEVIHSCRVGIAHRREPLLPETVGDAHPTMAHSVPRRV